MLKTSVLNRTIWYSPVHLLLGFNQVVLIDMEHAKFMEYISQFPAGTRNLNPRMSMCMSVLQNATSAAVLVLFNTCFEC